METFINTKVGPVKGTLQDGIASFKGLPYAKAPVKDLRWRPPQPALPWDGVFDATHFGHTSWSFLVGDDNSIADEDCLNLNIWTPSTDGDAKLPVMVYIHEGGFVFGNGTKANLDGQRLARKDVVVVTFNYRLGSFGFLALADLDKEGSNSGMFGIQDQQAALRWVQAHISSFGGNPDNVTVFGESAGAHAIGILMCSPASEGLFHKAILQSGAFWNQVLDYTMDFARAREHGKNIFDKLKVSSVAELRDVPAKTFVDMYPFDFSGPPDLLSFAPSIDEYVLFDKALRVFQNNKQMQIPMLAGFTVDEGSLFKDMLITHSTPEEWELIGKTVGGPERYAEFLSCYPTDSAGKPLPKSINDFIGDLYLAHQTWKAATAQIAAGIDDVYMYIFSYTSEYNPLALHASDINFTFGNIDQPLFYHPPFVQYSEADRKFSDALMTYWTNFAKSGDPNAKGNDDLPTWPKYQGGEGKVMGLGKELGETRLPIARFEFIDSLFKDGELSPEWLDLASSKIASK